MNIYLLLLLLLVKHYIFDFVWQTKKELLWKGVYGSPCGMMHSLKHGLGTTLVTWNPFFGLLDAVVHYHVDYSKKRWGEWDEKVQKYWYHLGLDQLLHNLTYVLIVWMYFK